MYTYMDAFRYVFKTTKVALSPTPPPPSHRTGVFDRLTTVDRKPAANRKLPSACLPYNRTARYETISSRIGSFSPFVFPFRSVPYDFRLLHYWCTRRAVLIRRLRLRELCWLFTEVDSYEIEPFRERWKMFKSITIIVNVRNVFTLGAIFNGVQEYNCLCYIVTSNHH